MKTVQIDLKALLSRGDQQKIAAQLNISRQAVSDALDAARPGNRVVKLALQMAKDSGALDAAQALSTLASGTQPQAAA